jgi:hypothetical protein
MRRLWRWLGVLAVVLLFATAAAAALPHFAFELHAPHTAKKSAATLDKSLERAVDASLAKTKIDTTEGAMDFALAATDKLLHFNREHATSLSFEAAEREGNCAEYAHLFAKVFERAAQKNKLGARAFVVHSDKAQMFGQKMPFKGFEEHDWVLVVEGTGDEARRFYVDPAMHDAGLGWDIAANVRGAVKMPDERATASSPPAVKKASPHPWAASGSSAR